MAVRNDSEFVFRLCIIALSMSIFVCLLWHRQCIFALRIFTPRIQFLNTHSFSFNNLLQQTFYDHGSGMVISIPQPKHKSFLCHVLILLPKIRKEMNVRESEDNSHSNVYDSALKYITFALKLHCISNKMCFETN